MWLLVRFDLEFEPFLICFLFFSHKAIGAVSLSYLQIFHQCATRACSERILFESPRLGLWDLVLNLRLCGEVWYITELAHCL